MTTRSILIIRHRAQLNCVGGRLNAWVGLVVWAWATPYITAPMVNAELWNIQTNMSANICKDNLCVAIRF